MLSKRGVGSFEYLRILGSSGLAATYLARDTRDQSPAVVKVFRGYFLHEPDLFSRFVRKLEEVAKLDHPNIRIHSEIGQDAYNFWMVFPYLPGNSLEQGIKNQEISIPDTISIIRSLGDILEYAHSLGQLHRNLKPSNIFLMDDRSAKVTDFGIIDLAEGLHATVRSTVRTPNPWYAAPEQLQERECTSQTDVFSLGVIAYQLLTGEIPFPALGGPSVLAKQLKGPPRLPSQINLALNADVDTILLRALATHPSLRQDTPRKLTEELTNVLEALDWDQGLHSRSVESGSNNSSDSLSDQAPRIPDPIYCSGCGHKNDSSRKFCELCWGSLVATVGISEEESKNFVRGVKREWRRQRFLRNCVLGGVWIAFGLYILSIFFSLPVASPSSAVNGTSMEGEWVSHGRDFQHTSAVDEGNTIRGELVWEFSTDLPLLATPSLAGGVIYLATGDKRIIAIEADTGRMIWQRDVGTPLDSTPAIAEQTLVVGVRDGRVLALDRQTGEPLWDFQTGNPVFSSPVIHEGVVYVGSGDGFLYALDFQTGTELWKYDVEGWVITSPVIHGDLVGVTTASGWAWLIDRGNGQKQLRFRSTAPIIRSPAVVDDKLILTNIKGRVTAVDWHAIEYPGERTARYWRMTFFIWGLQDEIPIQKGFLWSKNFGSRITVSSPAVAGTQIFVGTSDGKIFALENTTGGIDWEYDTLGSSVGSSPAVIGPNVYIGADDGSVHILDRKTGTKLDEFWVGGPVVGQIVTSGKMMYLTSSDGTLYAFR